MRFVKQCGNQFMSRSIDFSIIFNKFVNFLEINILISFNAIFCNLTKLNFIFDLIIKEKF